MSIFAQLLAQQSEQTLYASRGCAQLHQVDGRHWLYTGGEAIQSVYDESQPQLPVLQYQRLMLVALTLLKGPAERVLNLGLGCGTFERVFAHLPVRVKYWQAVECDGNLIALLGQHFPLPRHCLVTECDAMDFVKTDKYSYDFILCDLFVGQYHARCIDSPEFFSLLAQRLDCDGAVALNLAPQSNAHMIKLLESAKRFFKGGYIVNIDDCANVVLCLSKQALPAESLIGRRIQLLAADWPLPFRQMLAKMHRI